MTAVTDAAPRCPTCGNPAAADAAFCGVCYEVLKKRAASPAASAPPPGPEPSVATKAPTARHLPWAVSLVIALWLAWGFRDALPITAGWERITRLYPTGLANFLFHEGGHMVFGLLGLGNQFLTVLGGSAMQLLIPAACAIHLYLQKSRVGSLLCLAWLGQSAVDLSFYIADAKQQVLILITGRSGSEGSFHDWAYLLDCFGLRRYAVGFGQTVFFFGCWLALWALLELAVTLLARHPAESRGPVETR